MFFSSNELGAFQRCKNFALTYAGDYRNSFSLINNSNGYLMLNNIALGKKLLTGQDFSLN
ncbi:hypothetical protein VAEU17_190039 [Vibrio aestuarianus]|nr:hypothetical protein VAEU17_190039 [Vibrio aestuarianus]